MTEQVCPECLGGLGRWYKVGDTGYFKECESCAGTGRLLLQEPCSACKGKGKVPSLNVRMFQEWTCQECNGTGKTGMGKEES